MQFTVVKSEPNKPAKFIKTTTLQDQAILAVLDETYKQVKKAVRNGCRVDITDSCKRGNYLGNVFISDKKVRANKYPFLFALDKQWGPIYNKLQDRLYKGSATAVFMTITNRQVFGDITSLTIVATDDDGQPTKVPNWWKK